MLLVRPTAWAPAGLASTLLLLSLLVLSANASPQPTDLPLRPRQTTIVSTVSSANSSTVSIPSTAAAGGLVYTQPAATAAASYIKIMSGNYVTFGWNYTSLYVTPASLTFVAYCSANSYTYPVGPTTGIPGATSQYVWDPWGYQQSAGAIPFAQASYTLKVWDERGADAVATGGYFYGSNTVVNFAMYSPAAYTPLASGWTCVACSSAMGLLGNINHHLLVAVPVTVSLILIGGAGVFNR
ncbi:hypothetical protein MNV49_000995 [Pseudohyphozyma bogoriensis]|nr:hypothetical protein MNV49_000995 [Pseudohyphozyma bogoriensis]